MSILPSTNKTSAIAAKIYERSQMSNISDPLNFCLISLLCFIFFFGNVQKQPSRGVFKNRCSENMQKIYRRTPMPKCDSNKVAKQLYRNRTLAWVFSCKLAAYFQNTSVLKKALDGCF